MSLGEILIVVLVIWYLLTLESGKSDRRRTAYKPDPPTKSPRTKPNKE